MDTNAFKISVLNQFRDANSGIRALMFADFATDTLLDGTSYSRTRSFVNRNHRLCIDVDSFFNFDKVKFQVKFREITDEMDIKREIKHGTDMTSPKLFEKFYYFEDVYFLDKFIMFRLKKLVLEEKDSKYEFNPNYTSFEIGFNTKTMQFSEASDVKQFCKMCTVLRKGQAKSYCDYVVDIPALVRLHNLASRLPSSNVIDNAYAVVKAHLSVHSTMQQSSMMKALSALILLQR